MINAKSRRLHLIHVLALAVILVVVAGCTEHEAGMTSQNRAFDRVASTKVLRAGYIAYPPSCIVDPKTGAVSGVFVDVLRKIADNLGWKLEFVEEVGWGTMIQGLEDGRYDIMASTAWANPVRGRLTTMSDPVYFSALGVWARANESRFALNEYRQQINDPEVRIAAMDGSTPAVIAKEDFPNAKLITYPDLTGEPQLFLDLVGGKVDVFFAEPAVAGDFLKSHPGAIKNIGPASPIRVFANVYLMAANEPRLKQAVDVALRDLLTSGFVENTISHYANGAALFYEVAKPFGGPVPRATE